MRTLNPATRNHLLRDPKAIEFSRDNIGETYNSYRPDINRVIQEKRYYDGGRTVDFFKLSSGEHTSGQETNANGHLVHSSNHIFGKEINTTLLDRFLGNCGIILFYAMANDIRHSDLKSQPIALRAPGISEKRRRELAF
jgi:hypothetical protein